MHNAYFDASLIWSGNQKLVITLKYSEDIFDLLPLKWPAWMSRIFVRNSETIRVLMEGCHGGNRSCTMGHFFLKTYFRAFWITQDRLMINVRWLWVKNQCSSEPLWCQRCPTMLFYLVASLATNLKLCLHLRQTSRPMRSSILRPDSVNIFVVIADSSQKKFATFEFQNIFVFQIIQM